MTGLASVILSGAKNLNSRRVLARKVQTDALPSIFKSLLESESMLESFVKLEDIALATVIHPLGGFLVVVCSHRS